MPPTTSRRAAATAARRAQIIAASIATIAELGYRRTTFGRIAERGGLSSTRLISYHFASKDDLVAAVVADIFTSINEFLIDRAREDPATRPLQNPPDTVQRPRNSSGADELRAYITGVVAFVDAHRVRMRALQSIFAAVHDEPRNAAAYSPDTDRGSSAISKTSSDTDKHAASSGHSTRSPWRPPSNAHSADCPCCCRPSPTSTCAITPPNW